MSHVPIPPLPHRHRTHAPLQELFDYGGEGVGYHDDDPEANTGSCALRPYDGVDVYEENLYIPPGSFKFGNSGGAYVKYMKGEWTAYSVT
jgi:hypothetical protein